MRYGLSKVIGTALYVGLLFAVLFDPTEAALGSSLVTLPAFALSAAEIFGNVTWLIGLLYVFATGIFIAILGSDSTRENYVTSVIKNGGAKGFKLKWHRYLSVPFFAIMAVVTVGSGFWFTGFFWLVGLWLGYATCADIRNNSVAYNAFLAAKA